MQPGKLPLSRQVAYAMGMFGWSVMINIITVILVYFYLPPANSGLVNLVSQLAVFGIFNAMSLITASTRLLDAFVDPLIANYTDKSTNPGGRRIPLMKLCVLPSLLFCSLVFMPWDNAESTSNITWLVLMLAGFYISTTAYAIPYNALLPELATNKEDRLKLSTFQSLGFVFGVALSSNAFNFADMLQAGFAISNRIEAVQYTVWGMAFVGAIAMLIPVLFIDEKKYCLNSPSAIPVMQALKHSLRNRNFVVFIAADFAYFMSISIITSGLLYYVTVLAGLEESTGNKLMITMVLVSLLFYIPVARFAEKAGKKKLVILSFVLMSIVFLAIYSLGKLPVLPVFQLYGLVILFSLPFAILGILPNTIISEIAANDAAKTGQNQEAMYFAVRLLFDKLGQTLGLSLFAMLTLYGKDPGNDMGLRLNGICGFVLCMIAGFIFLGYKESERGAGNS